MTTRINTSVDAERTSNAPAWNAPEKVDLRGSLFSCVLPEVCTDSPDDSEETERSNLRKLEGLAEPLDLLGDKILNDLADEERHEHRDSKLRIAFSQALVVTKSAKDRPA